MPDLPPDNPVFLAADAKAAGGDNPARSPAVSRSLALAVAGYRKSDVFRIGLSAATRATRRRMLADIRTRYGQARIAELRTKHVETDLNRLTGHARNNRLKAWRGFGKWLADNYHIEDPSAAARKAPVAATDGHLPWLEAEVEVFRHHWPAGAPERLAFEVIYWTGARVSDAVRLGPGAVRLGPGNVDRDGWLAFRRQKTGGEGAIPFDRPLPDFAEEMTSDLAYLHAALDAREARHLTWITTTHGKSRNVKAAGQWFAAKARAAGIHGRSAHGLRKSRARALAEAEGNPPRSALGPVTRAFPRSNATSEISANGGRSRARRPNEQFQLRRPKFQIGGKMQEKQMLDKPLATPAGLEPATCPLGGGCSIQLSHGAARRLNAVSRAVCLERRP